MPDTTWPRPEQSPTAQNHGEADGRPPSVNNVPAIGDLPPEQLHRKRLSCLGCRQRKVKCDKGLPACGVCRRHEYECIYQPRRERERKPQQKKGQNIEIVRRLGNLEKMLQKYESKKDPTRLNARSEEAEVPLSGNEAPHTTQESVAIDPSTTSYQSPPGSSSSSTDRYMSSDFWCNLGEQIAGVKELLEVSDSDEEGDEDQQSSNISTGSPADFIFASNTSNLPLIHPSVPQIHLLCRHFIANVHPVISIIHHPTLQIFVQSATTDPDFIARDAVMTALLFSIYFAAVATMADGECIIHLGVPRNIALLNYKRNAEKALARADFLNKPELGTLQAMTLYLFSIRADDKGPAAWMLTGLAIRMAFCLGLHREGSSGNHTPYESELRRRLWWELYVLDIRASEDRGSLPVIYEGSYNTAKPANINDVDFNPQSQSIESRGGWTDTTFGLLIYEISSVVKKINYPASSGGVCFNLDLAHKQKLINDVQSLVGEQYLAHCNTTIPFQWFANTCAKVWFSRMQLMVQYPVQPLQPSQPDAGPRSDDLFFNAIEAVENSYLLETNPDAARWYYCPKSWSNWHALSVMLAELGTRVNTPLSDRAWAVASILFDPWSKRVADSPRGILWRPIRKLYEKALKTQTGRRVDENAGLGAEPVTLPMIESGEYYVSSPPTALDQNSYQTNDLMMMENGNIPNGMYPEINGSVQEAVAYDLPMTGRVDMFDWNNDIGLNLEGQPPDVNQWMDFEGQNHLF